MLSACSPDSIRRRCHPRPGRLTSWWLLGSRFGGCERKRRALHSPGPSSPHARPASPRSLRRSKAHPACCTTAARLVARGVERPLLLDDVEALLASKALVVDACHHVVRGVGEIVSLA